MYSFKKVLAALPDNYIVIWFSFGYRGHAVHRILSSHKESAWDPRWANNIDSTTVGALDFPETVSNFNLDNRMSYKMSAVTVHNTMSLMILDDPTVKELFKLKKIWHNKYIFITSHPDLILQNKQHNLRHLIPAKKHNIFLYCSDLNTLNRSFFTDNRDEVTLPHSADNVCSIDIAKLFSADYETFLEEYIMIVRWFDFTPRINAVRAFILRYLEREQYMIEYLLRSGKSFDKIKKINK